MDGHIEQIRRRAYELWIESGMAEGQDWDHWHRAEHELMMQHEHATPKAPARARSAAKKGAPKPVVRKKVASA
jgi:hypothetical protein